MGATESRPESNESNIAPRQGYHVIRVAQGSPAYQAGFSKRIEVGQVCNTDVRIVPSRSWSEPGTKAGTQPSLLGLTLRLCNPTVSISHVWHILDVFEGSPADSAGLVPFGDYIIGWTGGPLESEADFYQLVEQHEGSKIAMYVYNRDYDHTREVIIMPNRDWGGEGLLGCGVGYGLLHRIPKPQRAWEQEDDLPPSNSTYEGNTANQSLYQDNNPPSLHAAPPQSFADYSEAGNASGVTVSVHAEEEE
ncbi:hypothetical protein MYAM1_002331 [Malassezia yamatoensis]|uniref:PDZ GRASP-type domain-containing protein n=1 Tax=Malassezia yamatoensis TaxID=253288 RepID=A0AAJ5YTP0_9BASI|nr:hypothetical protein MYAM1_002331 [Malassezia yamatoensis]